MKIRFLLTTIKPTSSGGQYRHIHFVGEYDPAEWKSEQHMRRNFREKSKRMYPEAWNDPTREISCVEVIDADDRKHA